MSLPPVFVLGSVGLARDLVLLALGSRGLALGDGAPAPSDGTSAVAVLVDPEPCHWDVAHSARARIVLITADQLDRSGVTAAVLEGADAVLPAEASVDDVVHAIDAVGDGETLLDPRQTRWLADAARVGRVEQPALSLTPRETEILASIDRGDSVKQTARRLGISVKTVENLQSRLFRKLQVRNRAQAVARCHSLGLVEAAS